MRRHQLTTVALISLSLPLAAQRARGVPAADTARLEPIVVTATRDSVTQVAPTAATTTITGEALRAQGITTVQQALSVISSMTTVQAGSYGATTTLYTRGGQSNYTLLLVDGAPVNDPGGYLDLANLTTDNVDRIEVVRGPTSVLYGSDAISGVIQVFTRRATTGSFANVAGSGGTYGTRIYDLAFGTGKETVGISLDAARNSTDGILAFNNSARNDVYSGLLRFGAPGGAHLDLSGRQMSSTYHFPTDFTGAATDSAQQTSGKLRVGSLDGGVYLGSKVELRVLGTYTQNKSTSQNTPDSPGDSLDFYYVDPSTLTQWSADARFAFHINKSTAITTGGVYEDQQVKASDSSWSGTAAPDISSFSHSRNNSAFYLNATGDVGPHFTYNVGGRYTSSDVFGSFTDYRVGAGYMLSPRTTFRGSIGTGFREPSFYEEYATGFSIGNPNLTPEQSHSWEIGLDQNFSGGKARFGVTYFSQDFTDMIAYTATVNSTGTNYENIAKAIAVGIEAEAHAMLSPQWALDGAYTWLRTNVVAGGSSVTPYDPLFPGKPLLRRPSNAGNVGLTYVKEKKLVVGAQLVYVGSRSDIDYTQTIPERITLPSYALLNGSILLVLKSDAEGRFLALTFRGTNLLNTGYQQTAGFASPGRSVLLGIRLGVQP